jgi:hypothetical protein
MWLGGYSDPSAAHCEGGGPGSPEGRGGAGAARLLNADGMGDDPQILDYEDETLHRSDLRSLGDGCWLTDPVISFYLAFMHNEVLGATVAIQPMPPSIVFLIVHSDPATVAEVVAPLKLAEVRGLGRTGVGSLATP